MNVTSNILDQIVRFVKITFSLRENYVFQVVVLLSMYLFLVLDKESVIMHCASVLRTILDNFVNTILPYVVNYYVIVMVYVYLTIAVSAN